MESASSETSRTGALGPMRSTMLALLLLVSVFVVRATLVGVGIPLPLALVLGTVMAFGLGGIVLKGRRPWPSLGNRSARALGASAMLGVGLSLTGAVVLVLMVQALPPPEPWHESQAILVEQILRPDSLLWIPVVLLVVAVFPGVFEEFFFRGVLRDHWQGMRPLVRATGIGLLFAAVHLDPWSAPALFGVGVMLGLWADKTGGWAAAAVAHFALNAFSGVVWVRLGLERLAPLPLVASLVLAAAIGTLLMVVAWRRLGVSN